MQKKVKGTKSFKDVEARKDAALAFCHEINTCIDDEKMRFTDEEIINYVSDQKIFDAFLKAREAFLLEKKQLDIYASLRKKFNVPNSKGDRVNFYVMDTRDNKEANIKNEIIIQKFKNPIYKKWQACQFFDKMTSVDFTFKLGEDTLSNIDFYSKNRIGMELGFLSKDITNVLEEDIPGIDKSIQNIEGIIQSTANLKAEVTYYSCVLPLLVPSRVMKCVSVEKLSQEGRGERIVNLLSDMKNPNQAVPYKTLMGTLSISAFDEQQKTSEVSEDYIATLRSEGKFTKDFIENKGFYKGDELLPTKIVNDIVLHEGPDAIQIKELPEELKQQRRDFQEKYRAKKAEYGLAMLKENIADINSTLGVFTRDSKEFKALKTNLNNIGKKLDTLLKSTNGLEATAKQAMYKEFLEKNKNDISQLKTNLADYREKKNKDREVFDKKGKEFNERTCKRLAYCDELDAVLNTLSDLAIEKKKENTKQVDFKDDFKKDDGKEKSKEIIIDLNKEKNKNLEIE